MLLQLLLLIMTEIQPFKLDMKVVSMLKTEIQEQFKRTYGKPYAWKNLLNNYSVKNIFETLRTSVRIEVDVHRFGATIKAILTDSEKYQLYDDKKDMQLKIKRINKYEGVVDTRSLVALVEKNPGGLLVDEELTNFTFRDSKNQIQRAIRQKRIKRIYKQNTKDQYYYIFPRIYENNYEIRQDNFKHFSMNDYLDLCSHLNAMEDQTDKVKQGKQKVSKESTADPNYKLPGYLQLKQQWLKKNMIKK